MSIYQTFVNIQTHLLINFIQKFNKKLINLNMGSNYIQIKQFIRQQNSCLHIASQFGNIQMVKHLTKYYQMNKNTNLPTSNQTRQQNSQVNKQFSEKINAKNANQDTPLIHCLKYNSEDKMEKIVLELSRYSDLRIKDKYGRLAHQTPLPAYNVSKVRILQYLKQRYQSQQ